MRNIKRNMKNLSELPDDLLMKIMSLLPTKEAAATSVLSKKCSLWKQQDVDYVDICRKCSENWMGSTIQHTPELRHKLPSTYRLIGEFTVIRDPPPPPEKVGFASLMTFLTGEARISDRCAECKGKIHAPKKVSIYILSRDSGKTHAFIWTKLEEKQEIQIEFVTWGKKTTTNYCLSLGF